MNNNYEIFRLWCLLKTQQYENGKIINDLKCFGKIVYCRMEWNEWKEIKFLKYTNCIYMENIRFSYAM